MEMCRAVFASVLAGCCIVMVPHAVAADDMLDEDLGFNSGVGGSKFGEIVEKSLNHRDLDAHFVINNLPVRYGRPSTHQNLEEFEQKFEDALRTARARANSNSRGLVLLLESGASFYQKRNMFYRAFELMMELCAIKEQANPNSADVVIAKIACAKIARSLHKYDEAERYLAEALIVKRRLQTEDAPEVGEIYAELFYLYTDTGKGVKAALSRREGIRCSGHDTVANDAPFMFGTYSNAWPQILNALDAAATAQDLEAAQKVAEKKALEEMKAQDAAEKAEKEKAEKEKQEREKAEKAKSEQARIDEALEEKVKKAKEEARKRREKMEREGSGNGTAGGAP